LTKDGIGKMFCLAGIGGRVSGIMKTTESASKILAIDGCSLNCVKNCLQQAGFNKFVHLQLADIGFEKGKSPATKENIARVAQKAVKMLSGFDRLPAG
jgi:uncharacterized metal-binding protein